MNRSWKNMLLWSKSLRLKNGASHGFTVIEILMVLAIMSIVFGTIYKSFAQLNRSYTTENVKAGVQQGARFAVEFMVKDIRLAGLDPLGTANAGISNGVPLPTSNWIEISADIDFSGDAVSTNTSPFETLRYELDGNELKQTNFQGQETMLDNVIDLTFTFLDANDQTTTTHSEIRSVMVSLTMVKPAGRAESISRTYTTTVRCRNL